MEVHKIWSDWILFDEDGNHCGFRDGTPENIKELYDTYLKNQQYDSSGRVFK